VVERVPSPTVEGLTIQFTMSGNVSTKIRSSQCRKEFNILCRRINKAIGSIPLWLYTFTGFKILNNSCTVLYKEKKFVDD
jgi:hypothetical protein